MNRHYTIKSFFRQMPNALLAQYFHDQGLLQELDFSSFKECQIDDLFKAWMALPDVTRNPLDAAFQIIFAMSGEKGFRAIVDEADFQWRDEPEKRHDVIQILSALPNHYARAMTVYRDYNVLWRGATFFYRADNLSYWKKRDNIGNRSVCVDKESVNQLSTAIGQYFHEKEGRGSNCIVECFRRGELEYFFAYPEDYSQQHIEWIEGKFNRCPHTPAFEIVFVYSQQDGTLDLNTQGLNYQVVQPLQEMFSSSILKIDKIPKPKNKGIYDLNPLKDRSFQFVYDKDSGIESVAISKIRFSSMTKKGSCITLKENTKRNPQAIYDAIDQLQHMDFNHHSVTQVEIVVLEHLTNHDKFKTHRFTITYPNSCTLKYDEHDLRLRKMLTVSGIELKESNHDETQNEKLNP